MLRRYPTKHDFIQIPLPSLVASDGTAPDPDTVVDVVLEFAAVTDDDFTSILHTADTSSSVTNWFLGDKDAGEVVAFPNGGATIDYLDGIVIYDTNNTISANAYWFRASLKDGDTGDEIAWDNGQKYHVGRWMR